jgi:aconitate hydratase
MSPRYLGCKAVIVRSFARIHETNLKKQGVLAFTFVNPADYDKIGEKDRLSFVDLRHLAPNKQVDCIIDHADGTQEHIMLQHTMTDEQIEWFKAGSALNLIRKRREGELAGSSKK